MKLNKVLLIAAGMGILCAAAAAEQSPLEGGRKSGISRMFLDAHAPTQPPKYSRSQIKKMVQDAKTPEDFERLADYFDYQSLDSDRKSDEQVKELERLLALPFHARSYPTQVENTRERIKEYRAKADDFSSRASEYRAHAAGGAQRQ